MCYIVGKFGKYHTALTSETAAAVLVAFWKLCCRYSRFVCKSSDCLLHTCFIPCGAGVKYCVFSVCRKCCFVKVLSHNLIKRYRLYFRQIFVEMSAAGHTRSYKGGFAQGFPFLFEKRCFPVVNFTVSSPVNRYIAAAQQKSRIGILVKKPAIGLEHIVGI